MLKKLNNPKIMTNQYQSWAWNINNDSNHRSTNTNEALNCDFSTNVITTRITVPLPLVISGRLARHAAPVKDDDGNNLVMPQEVDVVHEVADVSPGCGAFRVHT